MQPPFKIGLIGCGLRGIWYLHSFTQTKLPFTVAAVADPATRYAQIASKIFANGQASIFRSGEELISAMPDLDGVIIASPNHVHRSSTVLAMQHQMRFLLEKPVAASIEDMAAMWQAQTETGCKPIIGFNLRYAPFYAKVQEICASGVLGKILVINAEELMSDDLSLVFARGDWRPNQRMSGGLMAEKCSHDMDLLNWLAGGKASRVSSFARRTYLTPKPDAGEKCSDCAIAPTCRFIHGKLPEIYEAHWPEYLHEVLTKLEEDTCVFSDRHTYPDHQVVNIEFDNGILCNFTVAQAQPATRRTIHILGSDARLYGVLNDNEFKIFHRDKLGTERVETVLVNPDESGHNGADSVITQDFFAWLRGERNNSRPGLKEGIEASLLSFAADQSVIEGKPVRMDTLRNRVFAASSSPLIATQQ
jgi:predicted dehydrogenase